MQHTHRSGAAFELAVVAAELGQGVPGTLHQERVDRSLMAPGQGAQFSGQREGDQEIRTRQQRLRLPFDPALALEVLAVRAASMSAGMRHQALPGTTSALGQHLA